MSTEPREDYYMKLARNFLTEHLSIDDERQLERAVIGLAMEFYKVSNNTLRNAVKP